MLVNSLEWWQSQNMDEWLAKLNQYVQEGYVRCARHPDLPLTIYNYTPKAQFGQKWDEVTRACRGLVLDDSGRVVISCISKFFNREEPQAPDIRMNNAEITLKLDGYMIQAKLDSQYGLIITSRGSFDNKYVWTVQDMFRKYHYAERLLENYTYCCELLQDFIGDETIIVAKHPEPKLVCWAIRNPELREMPLDATSFHPSQGKNIELAPILTSAEAMDYLTRDVEGVVLRDPSSGERVKIKTEWWIEMHRLLAGVSKKDYLAKLMSGEASTPELKDKLETMPEEIYYLILEWDAELNNAYDYLAERADEIIFKAKALSDKEVGLSQDILPEFKTLIFLNRKGKMQQYEQFLWRMVQNRVAL